MTSDTLIQWTTKTVLLVCVYFREPSRSTETPSLDWCNKSRKQEKSVFGGDVPGYSEVKFLISAIELP